MRSTKWGVESERVSGSWWFGVAGLEGFGGMRVCSFWPVERVSPRFAGFGFLVLCFRFRVLGFGFRVLGFGFRVLGCRCWVSGFGFRISGFRFRVCVLGFEVQVLSFGFRVSGFGFRASGLGIAFREEVDADNGLEEGALSARVRSHQCDLRGFSGSECIVSGFGFRGAEWKAFPTNQQKHRIPNPFSFNVCPSALSSFLWPPKTDP